MVREPDAPGSNLEARGQKIKLAISSKSAMWEWTGAARDAWEDETGAGIYVDRIAGGDRDHRHPGQFAIACAQPWKTSRPSCLLPEQSQTMGVGHTVVCCGQQRLPPQGRFTQRQFGGRGLV